MVKLVELERREGYIKYGPPTEGEEVIPSFDRLVNVWRGLLVESPANKDKKET